MANQLINGPLFGFLHAAASAGGATTQLSTAATWLGVSVIGDGRQLSKVKISVSAVTGTLGATDLTCDVYSDATGSPNASLQSRNTVTSGASAGAMLEFTGFTQTLTRGTRYWLVFKNANGTPASNNVTYQFLNNTHDYFREGGSPSWGWARKTTTNSGTSWSAGNAAVAGPRLEYSDGGFAGLPVLALGSMNSWGFGANEAGVKFTTPASARMRIAGVSALMSVTGSPSGDLRYRLYLNNDASPTATTDTVPVGNVTLWTPALFSSPVTVEASTVVRVTFGTTTGGDSSNNYRSSGITIENDANTKALMPFGGWVRAGFDGTTWTDVDTTVPFMALLLDPLTPYDTVTSTGLPPVLFE